MPTAIDIDYLIGSECRTEPVDRAISALAEGQHGVVSRRQLLDLGLTARAVQWRLGAGRLHSLHRGVYAVGHRVLSVRGRWMAAVLAGGPGAALSHRSAAALWGIRPTAAGQADVTVSPGRRGRPEVRFHRSELEADEMTVWDGIPVTTVARTLVDLAAVLDRRQLEKALNEAEVLRLHTGLLLNAAVQRHATRPGVRTLRTVVGEGLETVTRSELEERSLAFVEQSGLPRPQTNQTVEGYEVDCLWRAQRVIVELDGRAFHETAAAFERDRERDRVLQAAGWRVVRVTWRQLARDGEVVARDLRELLGY